MMKKNLEQYAQIMLKRAKPTIKALVMDQDGTVKGGDDIKYKKANVSQLLQKIATAGKYPIIITASGASALKSFFPMKDFYSQRRIFIPTFIGIGNGAALYKFNTTGRSEIYNYGLTLNEVKAIIEVWKNLYETLDIRETDFQAKGIETFKKFMQTDWTGYIPEEYLSVSNQYDGQCFAEKIKVTVVFPNWQEKKQRTLVGKFQAELDNTFGRKKYLASRGDDTFLHITNTFKIDPKLYALQKIMSELNLKKENVAVFGDMPLDNDKGILIESRLPYTFTNQYFNNKNKNSPPFLLPGSVLSSVGSVYQAIDYLLL